MPLAIHCTVHYKKNPPLVSCTTIEQYSKKTARRLAGSALGASGTGAGGMAAASSSVGGRAGDIGGEAEAA